MSDTPDNPQPLDPDDGNFGQPQGDGDGKPEGKGDDKPKKPEKRKLRWFQYSLGSMFVLIVIIAIPCAFYRTKADEAERQKVAVAAIRKLGGYVYYDYQLDEQFNVIPEKKQQPPGWEWERKLLGIDMLADVVWVYLNHTLISDDGLQHLTGMTKMERLDLTGTQVGDDGLQHLTGMTKMELLWLQRTQVTDQGLKHLAGMTKMESLALGGTEVGESQHGSGKPESNGGKPEKPKGRGRR